GPKGRRRRRGGGGVRGHPRGRTFIVTVRARHTEQRDHRDDTPPHPRSIYQAAVTTDNTIGRSSSRVIGFSKREFGTLARKAREACVKAPPVEKTIFFSMPGQRSRMCS